MGVGVGVVRVEERVDEGGDGGGCDVTDDSEAPLTEHLPLTY